MIYLSSQPDDYFFFWQLQLQISNFTSLGIYPEDIHILIGYDPKKGLLQDFKDLINDYPTVNIHAYPDTRAQRNYLPSLRWHIIEKHFSKYPELQTKTIFFHDSDILLKALPDFNLLEQDDIWYVSDTRSYLNSSYIKLKGGKDLFEKMCTVVGISAQTVEQNDENAGGAQYLLKGVTTKFLKKIEDDSENLFLLLKNHNNNSKSYCKNREDGSLIQAWTADMWVIWWAAIVCNKKFHIHPELNFAWTESPLLMLNSCKILHYTGIPGASSMKAFRKGNYLHYSPFHEDLSDLDPNGCSSFIRDEIKKYKETQKCKRKPLPDFSIFIYNPKLHKEDSDIQNVVSSYLKSKFDFPIINFEKESDRLPMPDSVLNEKQNSLLYSNEHSVIEDLLLLVQTRYFALLRSNVILTEQQILNAYDQLSCHNVALVEPGDQFSLKIDSLLGSIFLKTFDVQVLEQNKNKLMPAPLQSNPEVIFLNTETFKHFYRNQRHFSLNNYAHLLINEGYNVATLQGTLYKFSN